MSETASAEATAAMLASVYGLPIVGMYGLLHSHVVDPATRTAAFGEFAHTTTLASPETSFIPAPNNDTLYSQAWLDLRNGPAIIDVPDTGDRYYTIQLLDLFSETLDNIGTRRYGNRAGSVAVVGPGHEDALPDGVPVVRAATPFVLAFLRILVDGADDVEAVVRLQQQFTIRSTGPAGGTVGLPPHDDSDARRFFGTLRSLLRMTPMPPGDASAYAWFARAGLDPASADSVLEAVPDAALEAGRSDGAALVEEAGRGFGMPVNQWRIARQGVGRYGSDHLQRAVVWSKGALANVPEESLYPSTFQDGDGRQLDGGQADYVLRMTPDQLPPARFFWSITMYIFRNGFLVPNPLDRYSVGDRTEGLVRGADGGLTLYLQADDPGPQRRPNWLPAPREPFYVSLRLYGPGTAAVDGTWAPPPVARA